MTKDEMKNRISIALKDPVLQQGFEIICKENAELKKEVEKHKWNDIFLEESAYYDKKIAEEYTTLQDRIADLEKENAELKGKFLTVKKDDVRKSKLDSFKTFEEKNEYLRQVATYAIFNEDIGVMLWCFMQRDNIYKDRIAELEAQIEKMKCCSMCKYYSMSFLPYWCTKNNIAPHCTSKCDKWEIKEK